MKKSAEPTEPSAGGTSIGIQLKKFVPHQQSIWEMRLKTLSSRRWRSPWHDSAPRVPPWVPPPRG